MVFFLVTQPAPKTSLKADSKPVSKPISKPVSSSTNQTYLKSIYGRQPHHTHRTTSKAPYLHYQSPVNPRTAALTAAILGTGSRHPIQPSGPEPIREKTEKPNREAWYYFHPSIDKSQVIPSGDGRVHVHAPLEGRKMPMAIPLGKPRTDPSLRLPLPTDIPLIEPGRVNIWQLLSFTYWSLIDLIPFCSQTRGFPCTTPSVNTNPTVTQA